MPTGNINVDHIDINSLSDTPLNQIKPIEDLPTEGTVSSPTGDQDISNAPLQISSSKRISLKTLAQYFDHILSQNNNLRDLKLYGSDNIDTSFNKLIQEISNGEISNISQILGDPKMTNSIWLFLVKTLYDLSKAQLNSFKSYTGFPESIDSFPFTEQNLTDILNNLQKYICSTSRLGLEISTMFFINKLWPLDNGKGLTPPYPSNIWERITSLSERIYYLFKWTFSLANPVTGFDIKPWERGNKTLYQRIVDLEKAVGSGQGDNLTTRVSHLENRVRYLFNNALTSRNVVNFQIQDKDLYLPPVRGGSDYFYPYEKISGINNSPYLNVRLVLSSFLHNNTNSSDTPISDLQLVNTLDRNVARIYYPADIHVGSWVQNSLINPYVYFVGMLHITLYETEDDLTQDNPFEEDVHIFTGTLNPVFGYSDGIESESIVGGYKNDVRNTSPGQALLYGGCIIEFRYAETEITVDVSTDSGITQETRIERQLYIILYTFNNNIKKDTSDNG